MRRSKSVLPVTWFMVGLVIGSAALVGVAAILPTEDPSRMYDQADLVCKGVAATAIPRADGQPPKFVEVNADYSFKGDLPPGGRITVGTGTAGREGGLDLTPRKGPVVLYLKKSSDGTFSPVVPIVSMIAVGAGAVPQPSRTDEDVAGKYDAGKVWLWAELAAGAADRTLVDRDRVDCLRSVGLLSVRPEATTLLLREISEVDQPEVKVEALRQRIRLNDAGAVAQAVDLIAAGRLDGLPGRQLVEALRYSTSDQAVDPLGKALRSSDETVRRSAAYALRHTDSDQAAVLLADALADSDPDVTYHAMMGLARLTGKGPAPAHAVFLENPQDYVRQWQKWWSEEGKALYEAIRATSRDSGPAVPPAGSDKAGGQNQAAWESKGNPGLLAHSGGSDLLGASGGEIGRKAVVGHDARDEETADVGGGKSSSPRADAGRGNGKTDTPSAAGGELAAGQHAGDRPYWRWALVAGVVLVVAGVAVVYWRRRVAAGA